MKLLTRLLREPLLHFVIVGGLAFLLYTKASGPRPAPRDTIVIEPERVEQLAGAFEAAWLRPPTDEELTVIVDDFVRGEIYYREALALGLDRDDAVIRQRLRQKLEFLTDTGADLLSPAAGELEAYFAANEQPYRRAPRLAFEQIFLGETPDQEAVTGALTTLRADPASAVGERSLLPAQLSLSLPGAVNSVFGSGFFEQLVDLPSREWAGPVRSGYGVHVVRITDSLPGQLPALEEVRDAVLRDWRAEKALELRERFFAELKERYVVEIRGAVETGENP